MSAIGDIDNINTINEQLPQVILRGRYRVRIYWGTLFTDYLVSVHPRKYLNVALGWYRTKDGIDIPLHIGTYPYVVYPTG